MKEEETRGEQNWEQTNIQINSEMSIHPITNIHKDMMRQVKEEVKMELEEMRTTLMEVIRTRSDEYESNLRRLQQELSTLEGEKKRFKQSVAAQAKQIEELQREVGVLRAKNTIYHINASSCTKESSKMKEENTKLREQLNSMNAKQKGGGKEVRLPTTTKALWQIGEIHKMCKQQGKDIKSLDRKTQAVPKEIEEVRVGLGRAESDNKIAMHSSPVLQREGQRMEKKEVRLHKSASGLIERWEARREQSINKSPTMVEVGLKEKENTRWQEEEEVREQGINKQTTIQQEGGDKTKQKEQEREQKETLQQGGDKTKQKEEDKREQTGAERDQSKPPVNEEVSRHIGEGDSQRYLPSSSPFFSFPSSFSSIPPPHLLTSTHRHSGHHTKELNLKAERSPPPTSSAPRISLPPSLASFFFLRFQISFFSPLLSRLFFSFSLLFSFHLFFLIWGDSTTLKEAAVRCEKEAYRPMSFYLKQYHI